ncbi:MAG TPA: hypothetical protein PLI95_17140 [Polyangiaceae bacterium]|nr:hypothetical protein [Polyangiaceae bacterium]
MRKNPGRWAILTALAVSTASCDAEPSADDRSGAGGDAGTGLEAGMGGEAGAGHHEAGVDVEAGAGHEAGVDALDDPVSEPVVEWPDGSGDGGGDDWWPQPGEGPSQGWDTGDDGGDCLLACSAGNYNQAFKRDLCNAGKTPGVDPVFYNGHYQFWGIKWDKMGTGQDHQGVCVTTHVADVGGTGIAATRRIFHDGCTGYPDGNPRVMTEGPNAGWTPENWGQAFHGACIVHDLCYKAEPAFSGKSKEYCDDQMEYYAQKICHASYTTTGGGPLQKNDLDKCLAEAANARFWLKLGSDNHYTAFNYPYDWRPEGGLCGAGKTYDVVTNTCTTP